VTISGGGGTTTIDCRDVPCKAGKSVSGDRFLLHVPDGAACSVKTPHGDTVAGRTSGGSCELNRSLRPADLAVHR
jgi:hypothetical protein